MTKIRDHFRTKPQNCSWIECCVRSVNGIYEVVEYKPLNISLTSLSAVQKKIPTEMVICYATGSLAIDLAATGTKADEICEPLNLLANQTWDPTIQNPRAKVTDLTIAAPGEDITDRTPLIQEFLLSWPVKNKYGNAPMQQDAQINILENKAVSPQDWHSMVDLTLVEGKVLKKKISKTLSKNNNFWHRRAGTMKATHYTIELIEGALLICQQPCCSKKKILTGALCAQRQAAGSWWNKSVLSV